jgi:hypothetical protein
MQELAGAVGWRSSPALAPPRVRIERAWNSVPAAIEHGNELVTTVEEVVIQRGECGAQAHRGAVRRGGRAGDLDHVLGCLIDEVIDQPFEPLGVPLGAVLPVRGGPIRRMLRQIPIHQGFDRHTAR